MTQRLSILKEKIIYNILNFYFQHFYYKKLARFWFQDNCQVYFQYYWLNLNVLTRDTSNYAQLPHCFRVKRMVVHVLDHVKGRALYSSNMCYIMFWYFLSYLCELTSDSVSQFFHISITSHNLSTLISSIKVRKTVKHGFCSNMFKLHMDELSLIFNKGRLKFWEHLKSGSDSKFGPQANGSQHLFVLRYLY